MKNFVRYSVLLSVIVAYNIFAQNTIKTDDLQVKQADSAALKFLNLVAENKYIPSDLICPASLKITKEHILSSLKGHSGSMMLLSVDSLNSMTPAQAWDYINVSRGTGKMKLNVKLRFGKTEIKYDTAYVPYRDEGRDPKVMKLVKDQNRWKVVLSFKSIF